MNRKTFFLIGILLICIVVFLAYSAYEAIYGPNVDLSEPKEFFITGSDDIPNILERIKSDDVLREEQYLDLIAERMKFSTSTPKPGRYLIQPDMSVHQLLDMLRQGKQAPISLTIRGKRTIEDLAGFLGQHLQHDSLHYLQAIHHQEYESLCDYLPDTYEFFWTTNGSQFAQRMKSYASKFWEEKQLKILGRDFTPCEIYILASIIEKETTYDAEKDDIAGVYINRLNIGMPLQADPTIIFSIGDFSIRRVLTKYLTTPSPFNTYLNPGLPPGPICMPSKSSLLAVLNASKHDYLYFCAKADNSGTHAFAETLSQHNRNARAFQRWMNQRGINR